MTTVAELIKRLQQFPPDAIVVTDSVGDDDSRTINMSSVKLVENGYYNSRNKAFYDNESVTDAKRFVNTDDELWARPMIDAKPAKIVTLMSYHVSWADDHYDQIVGD